MKARLSRLLSSRWFLVIAVLLAIVLLLPTLQVGFMMDDYTQILWLRGGPFPPHGPRGAWDLFRFQDGDRTSFRMSLDAGFWPWWSAPDLRLAFFRPISSLTHALDHLLFPNRPDLMRLESILIYGALVAVVGVTYRRFLGPTLAAGLALLMYAIDDGHSLTVTWISNRNAVLAAVFGFAAVLLHDHAVRKGNRKARFAAPVMLALGLLSAEAAVAAFGYIVAHAIWLDRDGFFARLRNIAPYVLVMALWTAVYKLGGYGAWGGEFYIDPGREPIRFLHALGTRLPILLEGQFSFPPSDLWLLVPAEKQSTVLVIVLALVVLGTIVLAFGVRKTRENGFFATGMLFALVPVCATFPSDRLLIFSGFGAFGLISDFLTAPRSELPYARRLVVRGAAGFFIVLHIVLAPFFFTGRGLQIGQMLNEPIERTAASLPPPSELDQKTLVIVNAPDYLTMSFGVFVHHRRGEPMPSRTRQLAIAVDGRMMVTRTDEKTLSMTLSKGFFHEPFSFVFRKADALPALGERFEVAGMTATVKAYTSDRQHAGTVDFAFDVPLDDPSFVWVVWKGNKLERFTVPKVGESVEVPITDYLTAMQGS